VRPFIGWIEQQIQAGDVAALLDYRRLAPGAVRAHPSDEHLLPLYVALGAAGEHFAGERIDAGIDLGLLAMDIYRFGSARAGLTAR
jgi:4,5-DOPA dioxygenase extradiol